MCGCRAGLARLETSTWSAARAGNRDVSLAPPLRRCLWCLRCLRAQRCPDLPTPPLRVTRCWFLVTVGSLGHPARWEGTGSVPRAGKQAVPPAAREQGWQMRAGMARLLRRPGALAGPCCARHHTHLSCPQELTVHVENHKCDSCDRAWHLPPIAWAEGQIVSWLDK